MQITDNFVKTYNHSRYQYTTTVRHKGTVIAFAMDDKRRIYYSVLDLSQGAASQTGFDGECWLEQPQLLPFPQEITQVGFGFVDATVMPQVKQGDRNPVASNIPLRVGERDEFLSSTARLSADAPFQVLSDGKTLYVLRQAIAAEHPDMIYVNGKTPIVHSTLLLDRFILVGNRLSLKQEVRYQRSRHKIRPHSDKDSLNAVDLEGNPFMEPTQELEFIQNLSQGRFTAVVLPTEIATIKQWQIFAYNRKTQMIDAYNLEQSPDGLFNLQGSSLLDIQTTSESALMLNGQDHYIEIPQSQLPCGTANYTIEAWVQGQGTIVSWGSQGRYSLQLTATELLDTWSDAVAKPKVLAAQIAQNSAWHHVAATFDGSYRRLYVDGIEVSQDQPGNFPVQNSAMAQIGAIAGRDLFTGTIDEVRVWNRARSAFEIAESLKQRLMGNEPGLIAYWQFDEAAGRTLFDHTDSAQHGTIRGNATWVKSSAPLQTNTSIRRDSFQLEGRSIASGFSAILYYQQENAIGGYQQTRKPFKQNARVMLAVNTQQGTQPPEVSILDFAVSRAGQLAQIPTSVQLPLLSIQSDQASLKTSIDARRATIAQLQQDLQQLETTLKSLALPTATFYGGFNFQGDSFTLSAGNQSNFRNLRFINSIRINPGAIVTLTGGQPIVFNERLSGNVNSDLSGMFNGVKVDESSENRNRRASLQQKIEQVQQQIQNQEALLAGELSKLQGEQSVPMKLLTIDQSGLTIAGGILQNIIAQDTPLLFDSATGQLALYFRGAEDQFRAAYYDTFTARAKFPLDAGSGTVIAVARSTEAELDRLTVTITGENAQTCTVTVGGAESLQEVWRNVPRMPKQFAAVLNGTVADPLNIATLAQAIVPGTVTALAIADKLTRSLTAGDLLQVGEMVFTVAQNSDRNCEVVPVLPAIVKTALSATTPINLIEYDYNNASSNHILTDLSQGSLLLRIVEVIGGEANGADLLANGTFQPQSATPVCRWVGAAPGNTLAFTGTEYGKLSDPNLLPQLAAEQKLSIEAWIKPTPTVQRGRILQYRASDTAQYALGIEPIPSALRFAATDLIELGSADELGLRDRDFLVEVWVNLPSTVGDRSLLGTDILKANEGLHLIIRNGKPYFGFFGNDTAGQTVINPNTWYHLAFRYTKATGEQAIFVNGELDTATQKHAAFQGKGMVKLTRSSGDFLGGNGFPLEGAIDDVRIWSQPRSNAQIKADYNRRLEGNEAGLVRYWHFENGLAKDYSINRRDRPIIGAPKLEVSPLAPYTLFANVGSQTLRAKTFLPTGNWNHIAATFCQAYAVQLDGKTGYLDCGNQQTLDLNRDLTIEVFLKPEGTGFQPILTKGALNTGTDQKVPYMLYLLDGKVGFAFETADGTIKTFTTAAPLPQGKFTKIGITRKYDSTTQMDANGQPISKQWYDIQVYINSVRTDTYQFPDARLKESFKDVGTNNRELIIGRAVSFDGTLAFFNGTISEVRLWNVPRSDLGNSITGTEKGMVAWWTFAEAEGTIVQDAKGNHPARLKGGCTWTKTPDPNGSTLLLYREGMPIATELISNTTVITNQFTIGAALNGTVVQESFKGILKDLRIWKTMRTLEQLQDNMFTPLLNEREDLIAYYSCDAESETQVLDQSFHRNHLTFIKVDQPITPPFRISKAPISLDIPQIQSALSSERTVYHDILHSQPSVQEYGEMQRDSAGNLFGVLKRCYSVIKNQQWQIITGFKVGNLVTEWVGQVQSDPQLIGFIEGAPPVPSENLTLREDYSAASSVELTEAQSTTYTYTSSRDTGFDMAIEGAVTFGVKSETTAGIGVETSMEDTDVQIGVKTSFENSLGWLEDASSGTGKTTTKASKMTLQGHTIDGRFSPNNVGFALVQSETADVFALRLQHNNALVSYQMRPNPDIPRDWNIITFPINAAYTKQGTLDGKVGLQADLDYPNALNYSSDSSYFKPIEAYQIKNQIQREQEQLKTEFDQFDAGGLGRRQSVTHFSSDDLAQGRSLDKLPQQHKRNLVNTYVWTADGGFFAESEETLDIQQETMGGSYAFKGMAGLAFSAEVAVSKVAMGVELQALFGGHLNLTVAKSAESQTAFGVNIELDVERDIMQRDEAGHLVVDRSNPRQPVPQKQPGKVDAYRFMTFYLEPKTNHFDEFFHRVIDPIWLSQSNDPNAIALRQANQVAAKPACWRVMHRVTYVSRVLETVPSQPQPSLEKTLATIEVSSNYELIRRLDPLVRGQKDSVGLLTTAVHEALIRYLPELLPYESEVVQYMMNYYGTFSA
ncbi:LamG-like jellyroll fold domain-containing protein [Alkalinema pantanalense CENA528]|uniref:LamG domain-containing protein n=1 Tax=Alkalinema pantanalense TaxID=1620705 RepID=UPI003D6FFD30